MKIINIPLRYKPLEKDINGIIYKEEDIHLATSEDRILELIRLNKLKLYMDHSKGELLIDGMGINLETANNCILGTIKEIHDDHLVVYVRDSTYDIISLMINNGYSAYMIYVGKICESNEQKYVKNIRILYYAFDHDHDDTTVKDELLLQEALNDENIKKLYNLPEEEI